MPYNKVVQVKHISDETVKRACELYNQNRFTGKFVNDWLAELTGAPLKVADRKLEQCSNRGLVNYGVSLRTCWWEGD